jgi:hypothetical protein
VKGPDECRLADYEISTDVDRLDVEVIHKFLAEDSYWSRGIPRSIVERAIENSLCFGVYHRAGQVGFARVVTTDRRSPCWPTCSSLGNIAARVCPNG